MILMNLKYNNQVRFQPRAQLQKYQRQMIKANNQIKNSTAKISVQSREKNRQIEQERIRREWEEKLGFLAAVLMETENEKAQIKTKNKTDFTILVLVLLAASIMFFFLCLGITMLN